MNASSYAFILTPIDLLGVTGIEIAPGHRITRASDEQVEYIRNTISRFGANSFFFVSPYENNFRSVPGEKPGDVHHFADKLPRETWRYWVIEFKGANTNLQEVEWACAIIPNDFEVGFHVLFHESVPAPILGWNPRALSTFFDHSPEHLQAKQVSQAEIEKVRLLFDEITNLPPDFLHIRRALQRFDQLRWLPRTSEMVVIGLFSIIESLVSHSPKLTDSADSLSHQLRTKLPLLRKRFAHPLEHYSQFGEIGEENLWKKLYAYRSKIVHGENSQLSGDLSCLGRTESVISFLRETSKQLLQLSLHEPEFVTDLKKC